jgi:protein-L-isoaspartate(D-aspartate) O-methyltransferase
MKTIVTSQFRNILLTLRVKPSRRRLTPSVSSTPAMHFPILFQQRLVWFLVLALGVSSVMAQSRTPTEIARNKLVDEEIVAAGVKNPRVIEAMRKTPRHEFMPLAQRKNAYVDMALPIGEGQTISPPFVVAYMTEAIDPQPTDTVLEIGTGSGYQAAVLAKLVREVYTIEIVAPLGHKAAKVLEKLRYDNVHVKVGDGYQGWPEHAPFDKIIVTCSPEKVPPALVKQLKEGGRMVIPVGERYQQTLYLLKKIDGKLESEALQPTLFVPMTGKAEAGREVLPDPSRPTIENGGFESVEGDPPVPTGWHYQRQLKSVEGRDAPEGKRYVTFSNTLPGRNANALQGFAVDGRKVKQLELSLRVRGQDIRPGQTTQQLAGVIISFYDENRATVGEATLGPWRGTFAWQTDNKRINVPQKAREAILFIGLLGATGDVSFDAIELKAVKK